MQVLKFFKKKKKITAKEVNKKTHKDMDYVIQEFKKINYILQTTDEILKHEH